MIIKICQRCPGNPYTKDISMDKCPICGASLLIMSVSDSEVDDREELPNYGEASSVPEDNDTSEDNEYTTPHEPDEYYQDETDDFGAGGETYKATQASRSSSRLGRMTIRGRMSEYTTSDSRTGYRRMPWSKLFQAVAYGQRLEDVLHTFTVVDRNSGQPYSVNVHGSTNVGAKLHNNQEVEVVGKLTINNEFMASRVSVINGSLATRVRFQHSVRAVAVMCLVALLLLLGIIEFVGSGTGFVTAIQSFFATMITVYVLLLVLYVIASFSRMGLMLRFLRGGSRSRTSPLITMLIIAFVITLLLYNVFGLGTALSQGLSSVLDLIGPVAVMIIGMIILFKAFK